MEIFRNLYQNRILVQRITSWSASHIAMRSLSTTTSELFPSFQFKTLALSIPKPYVYHVELNRPAKRNAMDHAMWLELKKCFELLNEDENCRSVVLSGSGSLFCSGIDLQCFMDISQHFKESDDVARKCKALYKTIRLYQASLTSLEKCVKPVISAVHSACIGGAVNMICAADIRYCTIDAWFQIKEIDLGMAADVGVLQRLPKIIGSDSLARELILTGRKFLAEEAKVSGFVSKVFDSKEHMINDSINVAEEIASKSPVAVQTSKRNMVYSRDHSVEEGLEHIVSIGPRFSPPSHSKLYLFDDAYVVQAMLNQTMLQSEDLMAAIMANVAKSSEPPVFSKL